MLLILLIHIDVFCHSNVSDIDLNLVLRRLVYRSCACSAAVTLSGSTDPHGELFIGRCTLIFNSPSWLKLTRGFLL